MVKCPGPGLPPGGSGLTPSQSTKTVPAPQFGRKKRKKKRTARTPNQMVKAKLNRQDHTKKHTHTHSRKRKKDKKTFLNKKN